MEKKKKEKKKMMMMKKKKRLIKKNFVAHYLITLALYKLYLLIYLILLY